MLFMSDLKSVSLAAFYDHAVVSVKNQYVITNKGWRSLPNIGLLDYLENNYAQGIYLFRFCN